MELSNSYFEDALSNKFNYNKKYSNWYIGLHNSNINTYTDSNGDTNFFCDTYLKKGFRILDCMELSLWNEYPDNKVLDLVKTNRCMDNRFCPNCKKVDISRFICNFINKYKTIQEEYVPYMLTLTVPNCSANELDSTLKKLTSCFRKLYYYLEKMNLYPFCIRGGVRVLEITYNKNTNMYHPHYHCLVLFRNADIYTYSCFLNPIHKHLYSKKINDYNYISDYCSYIIKIWSLIWQGKRLSKYNIDFYQFKPGQSECFDIQWLQVDLRPLDDRGVLEIFKYTFKDSDVLNYDVFKTLYFSLMHKRLRQGFGVLYDLKCEDFTEEEIEELNLEFEEAPYELIIFQLQELLQTYPDYKKYSRMNSDKYI